MGSLKRRIEWLQYPLCFKVRLRVWTIVMIVRYRSCRKNIDNFIYIFRDATLPAKAGIPAFFKFLLTFPAFSIIPVRLLKTWQYLKSRHKIKKSAPKWLKVPQKSIFWWLRPEPRQGFAPGWVVGVVVVVGCVAISGGMDFPPKNQ